ncbi:ABC1 kinase family protein [Emiliania huxleyi CCMP1516]|uniref:ABC1 atypical kinase-like domain-containing protein n=2 Tax=Emiliania huxleyi TaxID=2903 RepID=A0A0D3K8P0_EMIH1|nr:ABC1 kinase family protein [Emiliania huxleyi CCMP1516]EOD32125.1 ABC1 kinase family protein [Emiliania huxleyi CCMP1516]|eukprot:XP_005784554.1 ABC1 kinase family protein [Emiliania huxleyi CCMP1516]
MAASLQRFRLRASVRPRLPCIPRRTHAYCVAARTPASCVAARATVLALAAGAWRHRKQPALCEPPPPPPPLPPLETALAPVASEQPLPLARRLARVAFYALRAAYLWLVFSPLLLSSPLAFWQKRFPQLEEVWWSWCIATLERTGALAIKLAQWASSRPDLFSSRVCGRLQHLQDHTQPHSLEATEAALDAAFGPGWRSVLRIAPHPVGSGCIAQVHRGELLRDGEWGPVAVKVLHPQVGRYIRADGALLRLVCGGLQRLPRVRSEADNLRRFRANFARAGGGAPPVDFPDPVGGYVARPALCRVVRGEARAVLVESWVDGVPMIEWAAGLAETAEERQQLCNTGIDAFCEMLFVHNFVHGDLHPGNVLVTTTADGSPRLAFLDAGIVVSYSEFDHGMLIDILGPRAAARAGHFLNYEGYEGGALMIEQTAAQSDVSDAHGFCTKIGEMVNFARDTPTFFDQACDHRVRVHAGFISIALSVKVVEGIVIQVDPAAVVAPRAKAVVIRESLKRKGRALLGRTARPGEDADAEARREAERQAQHRASEERGERERRRRAALARERAAAEQQAP